MVAFVSRGRLLFGVLVVATLLGALAAVLLLEVVGDDAADQDEDRVLDLAMANCIMCTNSDDPCGQESLEMDLSGEVFQTPSGEFEDFHTPRYYQIPSVLNKSVYLGSFLSRSKKIKN